MNLAQVNTECLEKYNRTKRYKTFYLFDEIIYIDSDLICNFNNAISIRKIRNKFSLEVDKIKWKKMMDTNIFL